MADFKGARGYARNVVEVRHVAVQDSDVEQGLGMNGQVMEAAKLWRRGKFKHVDGQVLLWLWPIRAVVGAAKRAGWNKGAASLRAVAEGGWPIHFKLWVEGRAKHNICRCGAGVGTLWHKLGACGASEELRAAECPSWLLRTGRVETWDPLFSRAIPARPKDVQPQMEHTWVEKSHESVGEGRNGGGLH